MYSFLDFELWEDFSMKNKIYDIKDEYFYDAVNEHKKKKRPSLLTTHTADWDKDFKLNKK